MMNFYCRPAECEIMLTIHIYISKMCIVLKDNDIYVLLESNSEEVIPPPTKSNNSENSQSSILHEIMQLFRRVRKLKNQHKFHKRTYYSTCCKNVIKKVLCRFCNHCTMSAKHQLSVLTCVSGTFCFGLTTLTGIAIPLFST